MKIYTTYYAKLKSLPDDIIPIAISAKVPDWYNGYHYPPLAPKYWFFQKYKQDGDSEFFTEAYEKEVLDELDVSKVLDDLKRLSGGKDIAVVCFEGKTKFCHRHLAGPWLSEESKEYDY